MKSPQGQTRWLLRLVAPTVFAILLSGCAPPNNSPVISGLESEKGWMTPSGNSTVRCAASDADGDRLTYIWSATGGTFSGTGSVTNWTAPATPGIHTITVTVKDSRGGQATSQLTAEVRINHPPVIKSLTAEPPEVLEGMTGVLKCAASDEDGDELSYQWSVIRGSISGQGPTVTWTAPLSCGNHTVTVKVTDGRGGETSGKLEITVIKPG